MGVREKVALLLVAVVFQIACTECKPQSLAKNPFECYVGNKRNGKNIMNKNSKSSYYNANNNDAQQEAFSNANIYKAFNFPELDFPSDTSHGVPGFSNYGSVGTARASNNMYNPALLDNFKKEARKKRKSKKQVNGDIPIQTQLEDKQLLNVVEKEAFPEVEYPLTAMDTWTPTYWNSFNIDESFTKQNNFASQIEANTEQKNFNIYANPSNRKRNKGLFAVSKQNKNKTKEINNLTNPSGNKNSKIIALVKTETELNKDKLINTTTFEPSPDQKEGHKPKKRIKLTSRNKLNKNRNITKSINPRSQSSKIPTEIPDSNKTACLSQNNINDIKCLYIENILNSTIFNNTTENASPNTTNDEKVNKQRIFPSSSNTDNFDEADLLNLRRLSSSELNYLAEQILRQIGSDPKDYEHAECSPSNLFTLGNLTVQNYLPENISDLSLKSKYLTSSDNLYEKVSKYPPLPHISELTALYYLIERLLDQINSQQNNLDTPNDISTAIQSTNTLLTEYIMPDLQVPDKINDLTIRTPTKYILPDPSATYLNNMNDKFLVNSTDQVLISLIPENQTKTDSIFFCPLPTIDQCSIHNLPELNSPYNDTFTLIEILNGSTPKKVSEISESLAQQNDIFETLRNHSDVVIGSKDNQAYNNQSYISKNEKLSIQDIPTKKLDHYNTMYDKAEYNTVVNMPNYNALADIPNDTMMSEVLDISTLPKHGIIVNIVQSNIFNNIPVNKILIDTPATGKLDGMPVCDTFPNILENYTYVNRSESDTLRKILEYDIIIPGHDTLENQPTNYKLKDMPAKLKDILISDTVSGLPDNNTMSDIPDISNYDVLSVTVDHKTFEDKPANDKLGNISEYNSLLDIPRIEIIKFVQDNDEMNIKSINDAIEESSYNDKLSNMLYNETLKNTPASNTLLYMSNVNQSEEMPKCDAYVDITEFEIFPDIFNDKTLASPRDNTLENISENNTLTNMTREKLEDMLAIDILSDMPEIDCETYSVMPYHGTSKDSRDNNKSQKACVNKPSLDIPEYEKLEGKSNNHTLSGFPDNGTLEDMSEHDTLVDMPHDKTLEDLSVNDASSAMPGNNILEDLSDSDTLSHMPNNETLEDSLDKNKSIEVPVNEPLSEYKTFSDLLNDKSLNLSDINTLEDISNMPNNNTIENVSKYITPFDIPDDETLEVILDNGKVEIISVNNILPDMSSNDTLEDVSEYITLSDMPYNETFGNMPVNDTNILDYDILDDVTKYNILLDTPGYEKLKVFPDNNKLEETADYEVFETSEDLSANDISPNLPDNNILEDVSDSDTLLHMPNNETSEDSLDNNTSREVPVNELLSEYKILSDILNNNSLILPDDGALRDLSKQDMLSNIPHNETLENIPAIHTLSNISDNNIIEDFSKYNALLDMPDYETLEDNNKVEIIPINIILSDMSNNDTLKDVSEYNTLPDMLYNETLGHMPVNDTDMSDNDLLDNLPKSDTFSDLPDKKLESFLENNELVETPEELSNMIQNESTDVQLAEVSDKDAFSGILDSSKLEDISEYNSLSDMPDNYEIEDMLEYNTLSKITNNTSKNNETDIADDWAFSDTNENNNSVTTNWTYDTYDGNTEIISPISNNSISPEIIMTNNDIIAKKEPLNYSMDTNEKSNISNIEDLPSNITVIDTKIISNNSNSSTNGNDFNAISDLPDTDLAPNLLVISDSDRISDICDTDKNTRAKDHGIIDELFDLEPGITNSNTLPGILDNFKLNTTDIDELLDAVLELYLADLETNIVHNTEALLITSVTGNMTDGKELPKAHETTNVSPSTDTEDIENASRRHRFS